MTKKKVSGYAMRNEVTRAINANRHAQMSLRRILNESPGPQTQTMLLAKAASALGENLDALVEIRGIISTE